MDWDSPDSYIHHLPDWPHYIYDLGKLTRPLAGARQRQGRLMGRMEGIGYRDISEINLSTLTDEIQKSSAIEGENLSRDRVRLSLARRLGIDIAGASQNTRDVDGVVDMMLDATRSASDPLTADRIWAWHGALFPTGRSGLSRIVVGDWRPDLIRVVSGALGKEAVHYVAPQHERVPSLMTDFLAWYESPESESDPVLRAGIAHLRFVQIHPLDDGNGRIGRALLDMTLTRSEGHPFRFYSMSTHIAEDLDSYYGLLESLGKGGSLDITEWLLWFVGCYQKAIDAALETTEIVMARAKFWDWADSLSLSERHRKALAKLTEDFKGKFTSEKYASINKVTKMTATRDIAELVEMGVLIPSDERGRSTSYFLPPERWLK